MIYHGYIENGHVVLDKSVVLPEGARVRVDVVTGKNVETPSESGGELLNQLRKKVSALPARNPCDGFSNRDHDRLLYEGQS